MIETKRLIIKPLNSDQLEKYINSPDELAADLGLIPSLVPMPDEVKDAIRNDLLPMISDPTKDTLFYTFWIIVEKSRSAIVGGICIHGEHDENEEVEIGYGIDEPFQNRGYMSETIAGLTRWLTENPKVKVVKAETEADNLPSVRVLERNGFKLFQQDDKNLILKLKL